MFYKCKLAETKIGRVGWLWHPLTPSLLSLTTMLPVRSLLGSVHTTKHTCFSLAPEALDPWLPVHYSLHNNAVLTFFSLNTLPHTSPGLSSCISIVFSVLNILTRLTTMLPVQSLLSSVH